MLRRDRQRWRRRLGELRTYTEAPYDQEIRDPSAYFVTYETGDNTVVTVDTATVPMDMYYSKAINFGDDYGMVESETSDAETDLRWDWLEHGPELAEEASVYGSVSGDRFYAVWNQELEIRLRTLCRHRHRVPPHLLQRHRRRSRTFLLHPVREHRPGRL